jgi:hypothetical protein
VTCGVKSAEIDVERLASAMRHARLATRRIREERREMVRQHVGGHWSEEGSREVVPLNLIGMYVSIVGRALVAKNPRVMLSTFLRQYKPIIDAMQSWANRQIERLHLDNTLQRVVVDSLFSVGICKVALATPAESASVSWNIRAGEPFCERVDLDDFVYDTHARDWSEVGFIGHRFRAPLSVIRDSKIYGKARKKLEPSIDAMYNKEGDERISMLGRTYYSEQEEFEDMVDLWEVYLPRHRVVLTLADDYNEGPSNLGLDEPLRQVGWVGPDCGPYHILGLGTVPGNIMPKAPLQDLFDLHMAVNNVMRKLIRTSQRLKQVLLVRNSSSNDAERINAANDGESVLVDSPEGIKEAVFSTQTLQNLQLVLEAMRGLFNWLAGNLDMLGGLSAESRTATQDKMLNENASRTLSDMQKRSTDFVSNVLESLCWFWHHDPVRTMKSKYTVPGLDVGIGRQVSPQVRKQVPFEDMEIRVDPYSMQHSTPQSRMQMLTQVMQGILIPMMPILQQQGINIDINSYLAKVAQYQDMPDLLDVTTIQEPPQMDGGGSAEGPATTKTPETTRNYVRENVPMRTEKGGPNERPERGKGLAHGGQSQW